MCKWINSFALLFCTLPAHAQFNMPDSEARAFIIPGYQSLDYVTGDLNNDKRPDAILILKQVGEDSIDEELKRPLLLLLRQPNGQLKLVKRNDDAILCRQCGGIFGDPYESSSTTGKGFELHFYGGSAWRWSFTYTFNFNNTISNWELAKEEQSSYHNIDIDRTQKDVTIHKAELGGVTIDSFNCNPSMVEQKWKVTAAKTYFYNNPVIGGKHRKGYLVKGNVVSSYRELVNFVQVYFSNEKNKSSSGFILKKDLVKLD